MTARDWVAWHRQYDLPGPLERRLAIVRQEVDRVLVSGEGPVRVLSLCSGDGRDLVQPLARHQGSRPVRGRLVEIDEILASKAEEAIAAASLNGLEVRRDDAGSTSALDGAVPADLVLLCGIFGNISDEDIERTIAVLPTLCADGATVIWTRHRRAPDLTPVIRDWFAAGGFRHEAFIPVADSSGSVGVEQFTGRPRAFEPGVRMFEFRDEPVNWLDHLEERAHDVVAAYRNVEVGRFITVRREVRRRTQLGSAPRIVPQLGAIAAALDLLISWLPDAAFAEPGGEGDWNVAQTIGHTAHARAGLSLAGGLAASGRWPSGTPPVVPGVPGPGSADRDELRRRVASSQRVIERAASSIEGHETDPCPLEHPLVGRLRCGEWLLFSGVHDLMHLEQLHEIEARFR